MTSAVRPIESARRAVPRPRRFAPRQNVVGVRPTPAIVRWSFVAFAASLPFEAMDLGFASSSLSLAKISGVLFMAAYLFYHNALTGKRKAAGVSAPLVFFGLYLGVYALNGFFVEERDFAQFASLFLTLIQLLLIFWIAADLLGHPTIARTVLMAFALAAVVSALGSLLALPGFSSAIQSRVGERVTVLEFNPNYLAFTMALAALILIEFSLSLRKRWQSYAVMASVLPLLVMIVRTGSRAGLGAFFIGFATYVVCNRQRQRWTFAVLSVIVVGAGITYSMWQHSTVITRFEQSYEGNFSGRQNIIPASVGMFIERPLTGWGPVALWSELSRRTGQLWSTKDAHNLYFHLLLEVGMVGAAPYFIGLYLCALAAWRARGESFGFLPISLMAVVLSANLAHTYLTRKPQWLMLALMVGVGSAARFRRDETDRGVTLKVPSSRRGQALPTRVPRREPVRL